MLLVLCVPLPLSKIDKFWNLHNFIRLKFFWNNLFTLVSQIYSPLSLRFIQINIAPPAGVNNEPQFVQFLDFPIMASHVGIKVYHDLSELVVDGINLTSII